MENNTEDRKVDRVVVVSSMVPVFFIVIVGFFLVKVAGYELDRPQAFTPDEGKTISYFMIPSEKNEPIKVFPGEKKFEELQKKGEYDIVHIPLSAHVKESMDQLEKEAREQDIAVSKVQSEVKNYITLSGIKKRSQRIRNQKVKI